MSFLQEAKERLGSLGEDKRIWEVIEQELKLSFRNGIKFAEAKLKEPKSQRTNNTSK